MIAQRYTLVFDAIRRILEVSGIENLTLAHIAEECGLHPNTVNYYFNGKTDMLMRFHTYMYNNEQRELPDEYKAVPARLEERVGAFTRIIDSELFRTVNRPVSFRKIIIYLYGVMDIHPQVKYYLGDKQNEHAASLKETFLRYCQAGILRTDGIDEGIAALITASTGYTLLNEYYDTQSVMQNMLDERKRISKLMLKDEYAPLVDALEQTKE